MSSPLALRPKRRQETRQARGAFGSQEVVAACHLEMDIMCILLNPSITKKGIGETIIPPGLYP